MKFDDVPRLSKLPFIIGDLALLLLAWLIAYRHPNPFSPLPLLLITGCVVVGCTSLIIPFAVNYVRDQEEAAASLHRELSEQFKRLMAASEHLQHATVQLKTVEEIATKNLQAAEKLPYRMQEKIAEFNQQLAAAEHEEKEALEQELATLRSAASERLATAADRIVQAAAEYARLEGEARKQLAAAAELEPKLAGVLTAIDAKVAALATAMKVADRLFSTPPFGSAPPSPPPVAIPDPAPSFEPPPPTPEPLERADLSTAALAETDAPVAAPRKPRVPKRPKTGEPAASESPAETPASSPSVQADPEPAGSAASELIAEPVADEPPAPENFSQVPPEEGSPAPTPSADGLTRLTVVSYIGIGNKLHLRGEGPGLSWDKGVPLQFVSIGRWRWETDAATAPVTCKVYKNDKIEAPLGTIALTPGTEQEVTATF
jgi:hypothetical protein